MGKGASPGPAWGSICSQEIGSATADLPSYVAIAERRDRSHGPGFLGTKHQPLYVLNPAKGVENLAASGTRAAAESTRPVGTTGSGFARDYRAPISQDHDTVYGRAVQMMRSSKAKAFDISQEPDAVRERYGKNRFGEGCLLARRLLEADVKYVEVGLEDWDTHFENNNQDSRTVRRARPRHDDVHHRPGRTGPARGHARRLDG